MQERWFVTLGFVPMLVGVVSLVLLRRPTETLARAEKPVSALTANAHATASALPALPLPQNDNSYLGVVVAGYTADVGAELGGSVVRVLVGEGAHVHVGDPIVSIDPSAASTDARMAEAEMEQQISVVARAKAEHEEASDMLRRVVAVPTGLPEQTLVAARAREASTRAAWEEARAGVDVSKARISRERDRVRKHVISAPFTGVVVALRVDPGDVISAGQTVARVISEDWYVRFAVPPDAQALQKLGARIAARPIGATTQLSAAVSEVSPEVDSASGLVFVRARLDVLAQLRDVVAGTRVTVSALSAAAAQPLPSVAPTNAPPVTPQTSGGIQ